MVSFQRPTLGKSSRSRGVINNLHSLFVAKFGAVLSRRKKKKARLYRSSNAMYYLNREQLERLIQAGKNERDRLILRTFVETGMRRFELAALRIEDLDRENSFIRVMKGKGQKTRIIPLTIVLMKGLTGLTGYRESGFLFESRNGGALSLRQINRIVAEAGMLARIHNPNPKQRNITCHLLRHSFARMWKEKSGDIEILSLLMGHSSVKTTYDSYARFGIDDIKCQYNKLFKTKT